MRRTLPLTTRRALLLGVLGTSVLPVLRTAASERKMAPFSLLDVEGQRVDVAKLMGRSVTADGLGVPTELGETEASRSAGFPSMARFGDQVLIVSAGRGLLVSPPPL